MTGAATAPPARPGRLLGRSAVRRIVLVGLFLALFFLAGNVLPPIPLVPGVPLTLQVLVVILAGALLGVPWGLAFLGTLFAMTAVGLPMMSGLKGGLAFFAGPTAGFAWGWVPLVAAAGLWKALRIRRGAASAAAFLGLAAAGVLADYACGAGWLAAVGGKPFVPVLLGLWVFLAFDLGKAVLAFAVARLVKKAVPDL